MVPYASTEYFFGRDGSLAKESYLPDGVIDLRPDILEGRIRGSKSVVSPITDDDVVLVNGVLAVVRDRLLQVPERPSEGLFHRVLAQIPG